MFILLNLHKIFELSYQKFLEFIWNAILFIYFLVVDILLNIWVEFFLEIVLDYFDETATTEAISTDVLKFGIYTNVLSHLEWIKNNSNYIDCKPGKFTAWLVDF